MTFRAQPAGFAAGILLVVLLALIPACSESPTGADSNVPMEGGGEIDPAAGDEFLLSSVDMGPGFEGFVEIWAYDLAVESDSIVGFDLVLVNRTDGDIPPPLQFVITGIHPFTVKCVNPDGFAQDYPFYDFSDDLGEDELLTPGESTAPVRARFRWEGPTAFSISFRLRIGEVIEHGVIGGVVFHDLNENGIRERSEPGVPDVMVTLSGTPERLITVRTDGDGGYRVAGLPADVYRVAMIPPPGSRATSSNPLLVALVELPDGKVSSYFGAGFGLVFTVEPPPAWVFGPVPVGPASPNGTKVDSTFVIPTPMPPFPPIAETYYVRIEPPPVMDPRTGVYPMDIDRVTVSIDKQTVYHLECPPDTLCPPRFDMVPIDPSLVGEGEHAISIEVLGSDRSFLMVGVMRGRPKDEGSTARD